MPPPSLRLPAALLEQIEAQQDSNSRKRKRAAPSRREARKQTRQEQKQRKVQFFTQPKSLGVEPEPHRNIKANEPLKKPVHHRTKINDIDKKKTAVVLSTKREKKTKSSNRVLTPNLDENPEDAQISWLEEKFGIRHSSKKNKLFDDGLDDLMDDLDRIAAPRTSRRIAATESDDLSETEEEISKASDEDESQGASSDFEGFSADVYNDLSANADAAVEPLHQGGPSLKPPTAPQTRYVLPHLRNTENSSEKLIKLVRQLKGLLNRLSEANLANILSSIEEVYREYPRHDVTSSLTQLIIDSIALHSSHLDTFVMLHAALIGALYKLIGVDFAAHLIQSLNDTYHHYYQNLELSLNEGENETEADQSLPQGKECLNLAVLLSELYNFQIVSCILVYDIVRELLDRLNEMDVELLLKILRNSGPQLRQDDPSALKDIVDIVQTKIAERDKSTISSRVQFMVETLTNLKNNKLKRSANPDVHIEQVERMKRFLTGLNKKHHVKAHEPLRVTLDDLRSAEKRGKWWLVGAAWNGNPLIEKANEIQLASGQVQTDDSLWKLARKQGMNTDVRRSIFVVLMSSDDYIDACERLSHLNLSEVQRREIFRVVLHCLGNEKQYNPYYALVLQQLTHNSHSSKITLQYCFWDFLRQMGEKEVGGAEILKNMQNDEPDFDVAKPSVSKHKHFARAFAWLIAKDGSSLQIFKPVDFTRLKSQTKTFMRDLFFHIFLSSQVLSPAITLDQTAEKYLAGCSRKQDALEQIFVKAVRISTLTQGLIYFIENVLGNFDGNSEVVLQVLQWSRNIALDILRSTLE